MVLGKCMAFFGDHLHDSYLSFLYWFPCLVAYIIDNGCIMDMIYGMKPYFVGAEVGGKHE